MCVQKSVSSSVGSHIVSLLAPGIFSGAKNENYMNSRVIKYDWKVNEWSRTEWPQGRNRSE